MKKPGGRNLLILVAGSILIAFTTTSLSLFIYHMSGDIYLDRSRPGFLPDQAEAAEDEQVESDYSFSSSGPVDAKVLDEYLTELQDTIHTIDQLTDPYGDTPLTDESLGITEPATDDTDAENASDA